MNGVSKITSEQNVMLITFTDVNLAKSSLASALSSFAQNKIVVDMISQSTPRTETIDFSFTTSYNYFNLVLKTISENKVGAPLLSSGFSKINLFGEDMVTTCGVAASALMALKNSGIDIYMITTSDLDISILVRQEVEDDALNILNKCFKI